jgi:hypothetical protein
MASKLNRRYTIEPAASEFPGLLCLWLRQKPASNEIIVKRTRGRFKTPRTVIRTCYQSDLERETH